MKLNIYTDETLTEVREVREVARLKIPYRVGQYAINMIQNLDVTDDEKILRTVLGSEEQITAVVRATFGLTEDDLACIDVMELPETAKEIIAFVVNKLADLGVSLGEDSPNAKAPATTA